MAVNEADFYKQAKKQALKTGSLYTGRIKDRINLAEFLDMNDWFGFRDNSSTDIKDCAEGKETLFQKLELWFRAYKKGHSEKLQILSDFGRTVLPETTGYFLEYVEEAGKQNDISSWQLLDFMLFHLGHELSQLSTESLEKLAESLDTEATRDVSILFSRFNQWLQRKLGISGWSYRYEYRRIKEHTDAYPMKAFSAMAYCVFNQDHWEKEGMLQKACNSAAYANLWAFIAMHFVCGLRSTDIIRIPKPELQETGELLRQSILAGTFLNAELISQDIQIRMRYSSKHPHKTLGYNQVPELKVFIPQTLEYPVGIIMAIAASYREDIKPGEAFIRADRSISHLRGFFGDDFMKATGGKGFASSRANKSYLQGIEMVTDDYAGSPQGYMMAVLARSHKGGIGTLPTTTDIYLKDAVFSGYSPEFIAREMFERGVFGFIPHLLLEVYAGSAYSSLAIRKQTELIGQVGLKPSAVETMVRMNEAALKKAKVVVTEVLSEQTSCGQILQNIASGRAVGKQKESLCIMSACGYKCTFVDRPACVGCRYEIYTKAFLQQLASEYSRMKELTGNADGWRYSLMVRQIILPAIGEYLVTVKSYSNPDELETITKILEGGLKGYDNGIK